MRLKEREMQQKNAEKRLTKEEIAEFIEEAIMVADKLR